MRGKSKYKKRELVPDEKFKSQLVTEFINKVLRYGKKETASKIVYNSLEIASQKIKKPPMEVFEAAMRNASPEVEVRSKRIGGATYQVPVEVASYRKIDLVLRWLINSCRIRHGKKMENLLADEIISMYNNEGNIIKKRNDVHRMAEANKAFAHFARF